ncbi:MAG: sialate O-acetylesterase [Verrucomicrobiota bacterium]
MGSPFGDHMVLQRDMPIPLWGNASANSQITIDFAGQTVTTQTKEDGYWTAQLSALTAGGPHILTVSSKGETRSYKDILIGEVWLCSGQSNMKWAVRRSKDPDKEVAAAQFPNIRLLTVPSITKNEPASSVPLSWQVCSPKTIGGFSAVGYYFGRELYHNLNVPIGLISSNWGGTPAEAWTPLENLKEHPQFELIIERRTEFLQTKQDGIDAAQEKLDQWMSEVRARMVDLSDVKPEYFEPDQPLPGAKPFELPGHFMHQTDGIAYFRKVIELPSDLKSDSATLRLGAIDDFDVTWVNGVQVGSTGEETTNAYLVHRTYTVPEGVLKPGKNVILVRLTDWFAGAAIKGEPENLALVLSSEDRVSLSGSWEFRLDRDFGKRPTTPQNEAPKIASTLYNGMISPLIPYAIRGVIWYQGESNTKRAAQYKSLFPVLINSWRTKWGQGDFPFYFVQLANFKQRNTTPVEDPWAELRDAQLKALRLPNTGMAVAIDLGEADDIHPRNKQDVGKRLALWALAKTYQKTEAGRPLGKLPFIGKFFCKPIPYSGPLYQDHSISGNQIRISFDHVESGLAVKGGKELKGFTIAGKDKRFFWANATIDGSTVVVSHPDIQEPAAVRYGWSINPEVNLINSADLPASPFRTDDWPGVTAGTF